MAIQKEIWVNYIIANLFKSIEFLNRGFNADQFVLQGKVVHIPQAGGKPTVVKNRTELPATVTKRTDTDVTYTLNEFTTDPILIPNADLVELSYDKVDSVLSEHVEALRELISDEILFIWAATAAASIIRTTGGATLATSPGATGNRKLFLKEDLQKARFLMNKQNISKENRVAVIPSDLMDQLLSDADLKRRDSSLELDMKGGIVARLYGFDLVERSENIVYNNDATPVPKALGTAAATTDNLSVLCFQGNAVERAIGEITFFENLGDPTYYGDIYSALVRAGGRQRRADAKGVIQIVQEATV